MRPRTGTRPVTLEPPLVVEILSLARQHDEMLKEARQDLFRTETKLDFERKWKWPVRAACIATGAVGVAALQNDVLMANAASMVTAAAQGAASAGNTALIVLVAGGVALYLAVILARRMLQAPSPEKAARKLMKQFAQRDGVAAYVLAGDETPEDEAASIEVLANDEHKTFRQRRLTASHRTLASSLQRLLNRPADDTQPLVH